MMCLEIINLTNTIFKLFLYLIYKYFWDGGLSNNNPILDEDTIIGKKRYIFNRLMLTCVDGLRILLKNF